MAGYAPGSTSFADQRLIGTIKDEIARLTKLQKAECTSLRKEVRADPDLLKRYRLLISIEGLGDPTALTLLYPYARARPFDP